jgi:hypothetical protein
MGLNRLPEDFDRAEAARAQVIQDILFAPNPPSIADVTSCIPQPSTHSNAKTWSTNNKSWNAWTIGALHKATEIRACKNKAVGWGSQGAFQRGMLENHVYEAIITHSAIIDEQTKQIAQQQKQLEIQQKLINELWSMQDKDLGKSLKKDEWIDIEAAEI